MTINRIVVKNSEEAESAKRNHGLHKQNCCTSISSGKVSLILQLFWRFMAQCFCFSYFWVCVFVFQCSFWGWFCFLRLFALIHFHWHRHKSAVTHAMQNWGCRGRSDFPNFAVILNEFVSLWIIQPARIVLENFRWDIYKWIMNKSFVLHWLPQFSSNLHFSVVLMIKCFGEKMCMDRSARKGTFLQSAQLINSAFAWFVSPHSQRASLDSTPTKGIRVGCWEPVIALKVTEGQMWPVRCDSWG